MGNEVGGIDKKTLALCDIIAEIPMTGNKESLNVSVSFGIVGYQILK
jgi:tRNA G18 (ribose-2'-O)-methylase SpoU